MKRDSNKTNQALLKTRQPLLKRIKKSQETTGAPPAFSLQALQMENLLENWIDQTRPKRQSLNLESTDDITNRVWLELHELADRVLYPRLMREGLENEKAAEHLSALAVTAAGLLEELAADPNGKDWINRAAVQKHEWPVNLSLKKKRKTKGGSKYVQTLKGADDAKDYLVSIELGQRPRGPLHSLTDPKATPFTKAAELILRNLLAWRERGALTNLTPWAKDLRALHYPMTTDNMDNWWAVAKRWLDEQWKTNRELFKPLIEWCKSNGWSLSSGRHEHYASQVRRDVIDVRLKEAFLALAKPADL